MWLNLAAQLAACQSVRLLDGPFVFAQGMNVMSYFVLLGGSLLDSARVFEQVRHLAASDPLTGLANYRKLLDVLDTETERTLRTGRPFAVLLLDLDGLKRINDVVVKEDRPEIRGMIFAVSHLVTVEEVE